MRARSITAASLLVLLTTTGCAAGSGSGSALSPASRPTATTPTATTPTATTPDGNGLSALPAEQITARARTAFLAAPTVHIKGSVTSGGSTIVLDVRVRRSGGGSGTLVMDGGKLRMVAIGKTVYLSGDRTFWKKSGASSSMAKRMVGKYLKTNAANKDYADLLAFYDLRQLAEGLLPPNGMQVAGPESLAGSRVITLRDDTGARYSVALDGPPYPVRLAGKDGTDAVALDFTDYGKPVSLTPPPAGQVIDVSQVG